MKKSLLLILLILVLAVSFAACNDRAPVDTTTAPTDTTASPVETTIAPETTADPGLIERVDPPKKAGVTYANDYMDTTSDELSVSVAQVLKGGDKSDGFVLVYKNEVYVIDGGTSDRKNVKTAVNYLMDIRKQALQAAGAMDTSRFKLRIHLIVSHFHIDHVSATYSDIIANQYIEVGHVFMQEASSFATNASASAYYDESHWGDAGHRKKLLSALSTYSPSAVVHTVAFGETCHFPSLDGKVTFRFFASPIDWGTGNIKDPSSPLGHIMSIYYPTGIAAENLSTNIANMNSMWVKVEYGERSLLFTGDTNKSADAGWTTKDEPLDRMINYYGAEAFRCDVAKYPHHGQNRDMAVNAVIRVMNPALIVFTIPDQTVTKTGAFRLYTGAWADNALTLRIVTDGHALSYAPDGEHYTAIYE